MEQVQNEKKTEEFSFVNVTKEETYEAYDRIKKRILDHHASGERGQVLHRFRMGLVISSGALGGLVAGCAMPTWMVALLGLSVLVAGGFFAWSISNLDDE